MTAKEIIQKASHPLQMDLQADEMKPQERMRRLIAYEPIDRIPVSVTASLYSARLCGVSYKDFWTDPQQSYRAQFWAGEVHAWDDSPHYSYGWSDWAGFDFGGKISIPEVDSGFPMVMDRPVKKPADAEALEIPDPLNAPVASKRFECARLNKAHSGKADLHFSLTGMVGSLVGNDNLLRWYYTQPKAVHAMYRKCLDYSLLTSELYLSEFGAENLAVMETFPLDSQNLISPAIFARFGFVYNLELNERLVAAGVKRFHFHLCGNHTANLPLWKKVPVPPRTVYSLGSEMDIKSTADFLGDEHIISGNVPTTVMQLGTPEDVMAASKVVIDQVKHHPGGFVLRPACGLPPLTPPANVCAIIRAAKIYGRYE